MCSCSRTCWSILKEHEEQYDLPHLVSISNIGRCVCCLQADMLEYLEGAIEEQYDLVLAAFAVHHLRQGSTHPPARHHHRRHHLHRPCCSACLPLGGVLPELVRV